MILGEFGSLFIIMIHACNYISCQLICALETFVMCYPLNLLTYLYTVIYLTVPHRWADIQSSGSNLCVFLLCGR